MFRRNACLGRLHEASTFSDGPSICTIDRSCVYVQNVAGWELSPSIGGAVRRSMVPIIYDGSTMASSLKRHAQSVMASEGGENTRTMPVHLFAKVAWIDSGQGWTARPSSVTFQKRYGPTDQFRTIRITISSCAVSTQYRPWPPKRELAHRQQF